MQPSHASSHFSKCVQPKICRVNTCATQWTASVHTLTHAQTCVYVREQSARQWTAAVLTLQMPKPVIMLVFQVLHGLLRRLLYTCPKPVITFAFKVLRNGLLRRLTLHVPKPMITFVFKVLLNGLLRRLLYTCPNL